MNYCRKCGRGLSTDALYGRRCWARLRGPLAALEASGNAAAGKAAELLRLGGLARLQGHGGHVFRTVSSDGRHTYLTARGACNCKSGLYSKLCHHSVAAIILLEA